MLTFSLGFLPPPPPHTLWKLIRSYREKTMWKLLLSLGKFHSCNMDCMYRVYRLTLKHLLFLKIPQCVLNEKTSGPGFFFAVGSDAEPVWTSSDFNSCRIRPLVKTVRLGTCRICTRTSKEMSKLLALSLPQLKTGHGMKPDQSVTSATCPYSTQCHVHTMKDCALLRRPWQLQMTT